MAKAVRPLPASSLETAIEVGWPTEEYAWLSRHPCLCGGDWDLDTQTLLLQEKNERGTRMTDQLEVRCASCGRRREFFFVVQYEGEL